MYGFSGTVHIQDAFDRSGHLRHGTCEMLELDSAGHLIHNERTRGWPVEEKDGIIYSFGAGCQIANASTTASDLRFPALNPVPSLAARTRLDLETRVAAGFDPALSSGALLAAHVASLSREIDAAYGPSTPSESERSSWGTERTRTPYADDSPHPPPPRRTARRARRARLSACAACL